MSNGKIIFDSQTPVFLNLIVIRYRLYNYFFQIAFQTIEFETIEFDAVQPRMYCFCYPIENVLLHCHIVRLPVHYSYTQLVVYGSLDPLDLKLKKK